MTDELALSDGASEVEAFWLIRGGGSIKVVPCPDGASQWHWLFIPTEPDMRMVPTGAGRIDETTGAIVPEMREVEVPPPIVHATTEQILTNLTLDEGRLFIGYCCHLHEHLFAHVGACISALGLAWEERRFNGIEKLSIEVVMADRMRAMTASAAKLAFDRT